MNISNLFSLQNTASNKPIPSSNYFSGIFGGGHGSITTDNAMRLTTVFSCNRVIAETLSSITLNVYKKVENGKEKAKKNPLYRILKLQPNPNITSVMWREMIVQDLNLRGNHFSQIIRNGKNEVVAIYPLRASAMEVKVSPTMDVLYQYTSGTKTHTVLPKHILHIRGLPDEDGINGISPIEYNIRAIQLGDTAQEYGNNFFKRGANPSGAFSKKDGVLSAEAFERLKKDINTNYAGMNNSGKPMLLEEGLTFERISVANNEAQFLETRKYQKEDIASIFRVPMHMINSLENATFSNIEHQSLEFVQFTMLPWFTRIEQQLTLSLLSKKEQEEYSIEFDMNTLLRGDLKSRAEFYKNMNMMGVLTINDILTLENRNTIGKKGDERYVQMNMTTIDSIKNQSKGGD